MVDPVRTQTKLSVQSDVKPERDSFAGVGLLYMMAAGGSLISPWWSTTRDFQLRQFAKQSDHFQGAMWMIAAKLTSVPFRIEPRDVSVKAHHAHADYYQMMLTEQTEFGGGWQELWTKFWYDGWTQDNGAFAEVIGRGKPSGGIKGPVLGISHLDASRCVRTSNPEFPVIYDDPSSGRHRFHHTRIIFTSQQPSTNANMYNVGHCWLTRSIHAVQNMIDVAVYKEEKLGSRPPRQMLIGKGMDTEVLLSALRMAAQSMDTENLARFAKTVVVGSIDPDFDITQLDLASVPDGFNDRESHELAMALIALAGGFPVRWLWAATQAGATIADAMFSHISGAGGGAAWHLGKMQTLIGGSERGQAHIVGKVLPPYLKIVFDYQDDQEDKQKADIAKTRSETRKADIDSGVFDVRTARETAVSDGDLTEAQFASLELQDGRLPNGNDVLSLFESEDEFFATYLDLGLGESPLLVALHEPADALVAIDLAAIDVQGVLANARSKTEREKAEQALAALGKLKSIYEPLIVEQIMTEQSSQEQPQDGGDQDGDGPEGTEEQETEESDSSETETEGEQESEPEAEDIEKALTTFYTLRGTNDLPDDAIVDIVLKQFNFGAKVGEVIRGALARGRGGRFANAAELEGMRSELLRGIIAKIRGKMIGKKKVKPKKGPKPKKKKPKGGGGGKPKLTEEQIAKKKAEAQRKKDVITTETINDTFAAVGEEYGVGQDDLVTLSQFLDGDRLTGPDGQYVGQLENIPEDVARRLAQAGLVRFDPATGRMIVQSSARALLSAAKSGDKNKARDTMARAQESVRKVRDRIEGKEDAISDAQGKISDTNDAIADERADAQSDVDKIQGGIDELNNQLESIPEDAANADEMRANIREKIADAQEAIRKRREQEAKRLDSFDARIERENEKIDKAGQEVRDMNASIGQDVDNVDPEKSIGSFGRGIRQNIRGLWRGDLSEFQFIDGMVSSIRVGLFNAWVEGAKECGISPDEFTQEEKDALNAMTNQEFLYLGGFAEDIAAVRDIHADRPRAHEGQLGPMLNRGEAWIARYETARQIGKAMACTNKKLEWVLGNAEHCPSCIKLAGKVKRGSFWSERGIFPRVPGASYLECAGFNCQCELKQTDAPLSKGPLPRLP
jgi:hypothetical protein